MLQESGKNQPAIPESAAPEGWCQKIFGLFRAAPAAQYIIHFSDVDLTHIEKIRKPRHLSWPVARLPPQTLHSGKQARHSRQAVFLSSWRRSSLRSLINAFVRESPFAKIPRNASIGSSGRDWITTRSPSTVMRSFLPGMISSFRRISLGITICPLADVVTTAYHPPGSQDMLNADKSYKKYSVKHCPASLYKNSLHLRVFA